MLLSDVFENFGDNANKAYGLDPTIRQCCNRYAEAYNNYLSDYDTGKQLYILYLDVNDLYY